MGKKSKFVRVERDHEMTMVKFLDGGAEIHKISRKHFDAYDAAGRYLGWADNQDEAAYMAENGFPKWTDTVSDLSLWVMWNDAIASGERPLEATDGTQFLILPCDMVMTAKEDEQGFDVSLINKVNFWQIYRADRYDLLALTFATQPLLLQ